MAAELGGLIQKEAAIVGQGYFARYGDVSAAHQPYIRDGVMRGAKRSVRNQGGAVAGAAGDAIDAGGMEGRGEALGRRWTLLHV